MALKYGRHSMEMQHMCEFGIKNCLTEASLGWKCVGKYNKNRDIYTFNDKFVRDFLRKSIKQGKLSAFKRYFGSNQCEEIPNTF